VRLLLDCLTPSNVRHDMPAEPACDMTMYAEDAACEYEHEEMHLSQMLAED
jgi:hypothetical protein